MSIEPFTCSMLIAGGGTLDQTMEYLVTGGMGRALLERVAVAVLGDFDAAGERIGP